jgi:hypothetical protein
MGAIEYLATQIREGSLALQSLAGAAGKIASAIEELAAASREGNDKLSDAIGRRRYRTQGRTAEGSQMIQSENDILLRVKVAFGETGTSKVYDIRCAPDDAEIVFSCEWTKYLAKHPEGSVHLTAEFCDLDGTVCPHASGGLVAAPEVFGALSFGA